MSSIYRVASRAVQRTARREFARTPVGQLTSELYKYKRGAPSKFDARKVQRELTRMGAEQLLGEFKQFGSIEKYALSGLQKKAMDALFGYMGPLGQILRGLLHSNTGTFTGSQLQAAEQLIRAYGGEVTWPKGHPLHKPERSAGVAERILEDMGLVPAAKTTSKGRREAKPPAMPSKSRPDGAPRGEPLAPPAPGEQPADARTPYQDSLTEEYYTPRSSNVYSFQYDYATSTMYVRFKAPRMNSGVQNKRGRGGMTGIKGQKGSTITGKTNEPGPLYAYFDVPVRVFKRLKASISSSPGGAVWDNLRIRGTVYGHQYRYSLVQGAVVKGEGGRLATYVSRRATSKGFRSRSVAALGTGRRGFVTSSIGEELRPFRGTPDRGRTARVYRGRGG